MIRVEGKINFSHPSLQQQNTQQLTVIRWLTLTTKTSNKQWQFDLLGSRAESNKALIRVKIEVLSSPVVFYKENMMAAQWNCARTKILEIARAWPRRWRYRNYFLCEFYLVLGFTLKPTVTVHISWPTWVKWQNTLKRQTYGNYFSFSFEFSLNWADAVIWFYK